MTVTAVIVGCRDSEGIKSVYDQLRPQVEEIIVITCCERSVLGDMNLHVAHRDDWGQSKCDQGLSLATQDYVMFASSDDEYLPNFISTLKKYDTDLILGGFRSHLVSEQRNSRPVIGLVTRGSFLVKREVGQKHGYKDHSYTGDGQFVEDLVKNGATWTNDPEVNYIHK